MQRNSAEQKSKPLESRLKEGRVRDPILAEVQVNFAKSVIQNGLATRSETLETIGKILEPDSVAKATGEFIGRVADSVKDFILECHATNQYIQLLESVSINVKRAYSVGLRFLEIVNLDQRVTAYMLNKGARGAIVATRDDTPLIDYMEKPIREQFPKLYADLQKYKRDSESTHPLFFTTEFLGLFNSARTGRQTKLTTEYPEAKKIYEAVAKELGKIER